MIYIVKFDGVTSRNIKELQKFFSDMQTCIDTDTSRWLSVFIDGGGDFKPEVKISEKSKKQKK